MEPHSIVVWTPRRVALDHRTRTQESRPMSTYFELDDLGRARGMFRIVGEDGHADDADVARFDRDQVRRMYEAMLRIRITDARMMALQRQGRIGFYGEAMGHEAAGVGAPAASVPDV